MTPNPTTRTRRIALAVASIALAIWALAAFAHPAMAMRSYLVGWLFALGLSLGALSILLVQSLTGGVWMESIRAELTAALAPLPLLTVFAVPIVVFARWLFPWAEPNGITMAHAPTPEYLNDVAFIARAVTYLVVWNFLAARLRRPGRPFAHTGACAAALIGHALAVSFAAVDWVASREPHWSSSVLGMTLLLSQTLGAMAFAVGCAAFAAARSPSPHRALDGAIARDLGNLLLTLALTWMYLAFSQFLIVWSEDLPHEANWYLHRAAHGWPLLALAVVALQFAVPFVLLLFRTLKCAPRSLAAIAAVLVVGNALDVVWMVGPAIHATQPLQWTDAAAAAGIGGVWLYLFLRGMRSSVDANRAPPVRTHQLSEGVRDG